METWKIQERTAMMPSNINSYKSALFLFMKEETVAGVAAKQ